MNFRLVSRETKLARTVADQDIQIRRWGGGGHPDPDPYRIRGARSQKTFFSAPWASVWSKNKGAWDPWDPSLDLQLPPQGNTSGKKFPHTDPRLKKAKSYQCNEICLAGHVGYTILDWKDKLGLLNFTSVQFLVCAGASIYGSKLQRAK